MKITSFLMMALASIFAMKSRPIAVPQMSADQIVNELEVQQMIVTCGTGSHGGSNVQSNPIV
jgi:hypothetical protein